VGGGGGGGGGGVGGGLGGGGGGGGEKMEDPSLQFCAPLKESIDCTKRQRRGKWDKGRLRPNRLRLPG